MSRVKQALDTSHLKGADLDILLMQKFGGYPKKVDVPVENAKKQQEQRHEEPELTSLDD